MPQTLTANEARIISCLMEKSVVTPDQYPLTLNALTNACNQKSARNPVLSLDKGIVEHTLRDLGVKHLVRADENFRRGVEKYQQRFCNTTFSDFQFDPGEFSIICLLLLRGPQTPGELRSHSGRLYEFSDNAEVIESLTSLIKRDGEPLVIKLPRAPGRKDSEYTHVFFGPVEAAAPQLSPPTKPAVTDSDHNSEPDLAIRVTKLEADVAELKAQLKSKY